jgi:hypothetical protein
MTTTLKPWLIEKLENCPTAGSGVHTWLFAVARDLHAHMNEQSIFTLLKEKARGCGRPEGKKFDEEIEQAVKAARTKAWRPKRPDLFENASNLPTEIELPPSDPPWHEPDIDHIRRIVAGGLLLSTLCAESPVKLDGEAGSHTEEIIGAIWPGNPLLCCGKTSFEFATRRREVWRGKLSQLAYIVPNPMLRVKAITQEGRESEHTKAATAARVYQVIEFDFSEFGRDGKTETIWAPLVREWRSEGVTVADACAALHLHLSVARPLVLVTHSGGKSLHGWYACFDRSEKDNRVFMDYAVRSGADPHTWLRSQFVRMPDGTRENGRRQTVYYFDPKTAVRP